jgi:Spy/CpxP family protein refolding chaperone
MRGGRIGLMPHVLAELDLSDTQRERLVELHERQAREAIQSRAELATTALDLHKLMRADRPDRAAIDRLVERMGQIRTGVQKSRVATMLDVRGVLTPEQEQKLKELRGHLHQGRMGRGAPWGERDDSRDVEKPKR